MSSLSSQSVFLSYEDEIARKSPLVTARLMAVDVVKIYLCYFQRNSWDGNWYSAYQAGCFHTSLKSAQEYAELNRKQGNSFFIEELPVLRLVGGKVSLLVTEANHTDPLFGYSPRALSDKNLREASKIQDWRNNYFVFGAPMIGAALSFHCESRFWKGLRVDLDSLMQFVVDPLLELEPLSGGRLRKWQSASAGGAQRLDWLRVRGDTRRACVSYLAKAARFGVVRSGVGEGALQPRVQAVRSVC